MRNLVLCVTKLLTNKSLSKCLKLKAFVRGFKPLFSFYYYLNDVALLR